MSTWKLFTEGGNNFRWEISNERVRVKSGNQSDGSDIGHRSSSAPLTSMADLLFEGFSKLADNSGEGVGFTPVFRTGLGKSVAVKQSSIDKALSILGDDDGSETGQFRGPDNGLFCGSLFQTGSGKMVNVSNEGIIRAKALLGLEEDKGHCSFQGTGRDTIQYPEMGDSVRNRENMDDGLIQGPPLVTTNCPAECSLDRESSLLHKQGEMQNKPPKPPPIKFHTAGGRAISVSGDALQRAKSLLGDPDLGNFLNEECMDSPADTKKRLETVWDAEYDFHTPSYYQETTKSKHTSKSFISPLRQSSYVFQSSVKSRNLAGSNLIKQFDAVEHEDGCRLNNPPVNNESSPRGTTVDNSLYANAETRIYSCKKPSGTPLIDMSNTIGRACTANRLTSNEKKRFWKANSVSPFKRPRSSRFSTPLKKSVPFLTEDPSTVSSEHPCHKGRISTRFPSKAPRVYIKEYFRAPLLNQKMSECLSEEVRGMKPEDAENYQFREMFGFNSVGVEAFTQMLADCGASKQHATETWVRNHYKWVVWKLACYERSCPAKSTKIFLTVTNVLEELKYRYEREVNHGHRSAIKRILGGDASPSSLMVLCVSTIFPEMEGKIQICSSALNGSENNTGAKVELTDGWYSISTFLDGLLSKQLAAGKLFVGQKLRIWGARLCGWVGPVSPLEASGTASLLLHINGTYRAHWADRLGFCKNIGAPLSFTCIKNSGGPVPSTLVGVTRIYPVLYKERFGDGGSIVRSERMEAKMIQIYNQRRSMVADSIISEFRTGTGTGTGNILTPDESDSEEGAKIFKILERSAEPELLMAEMSPEQLTSFATYQTKVEAIRQSEMEKSIEKGLADAGLSERDVTPFMRLRVLGLASNIRRGKGYRKEGLITIWNPTPKQQQELFEGKAYAVSGLVPINCDADILYLQAKGSGTKWQPLSSQAMEDFEPFFSPRKSMSLSNLGEVPLSSEFDVAAVIIHVAEAFTHAFQKKQWVFVTDGSLSKLQSEEIRDSSLLAINFCSPYLDDESFAPINSNLIGSTVAFCNLVKKAKDHMNDLWIAEGTENSFYSLNFDSPSCSHLKDAAASAQRWAKISTSATDKLRKRILFIVGDHNR